MDFSVRMLRVRSVHFVDVHLDALRTTSHERLASVRAHDVDWLADHRREEFSRAPFAYVGIGRGRQPPPHELVDFAASAFGVMQRRLARELAGLLEFLNGRYAADAFERIDFEEVRRLAGTCVTGCRIARPGPEELAPVYESFTPRLCTRTAEA